MRIVIANRMGTETYERPAAPRIGEQIDLFYSPPPTVTSVLWFPSEDRLKGLGISGRVDTIVFTE